MIRERSLIESKGVAQVLYIRTDGHMVDLFLRAAQCILNAPCRCQIGDIIHQKINQSVHQLHIASDYQNQYIFKNGK